MKRADLDQKALAAVERLGAALVYPLGQRSDIPSLWSVLYPRSEMRWAWDADSDPRVGEVWQLRMRLAESRKVVYCKWYQGRAVVFSPTLFAAMLATLAPLRPALSSEAEELYALLVEDSPQSTKQLRAAAGLRGRDGERVWTRSLKELWEKLLIVGTGEVDDGAFPSLQVGATRWIFEALWEAAEAGPSDAQQTLLAARLSRTTPLGKQWHKQLASYAAHAQLARGPCAT